MSMTELIDLVDRIEKVMNQYEGGWQNNDALRIIRSTVWEIRHRVGMMEGYRVGEVDQDFDHGYISEKLGSLNENADKLYSSRKHARSGGVDEVKRQAMGDCLLLRKYFGRPWVQNFDWRHPTVGTEQVR